MTSARQPRPREASWWRIGAAFCAIMAGFGALPHASPPFAGAILLAIFGGLGLAAWRWGVDTRDGSDWKPRKPGAVR